IAPGTALPVRIEAHAEAGSSPVDLMLRLFDSTGAELINNDDRGFGDRDPRLQTLLLKPGAFYIGVSSRLNPRYNPNLAGSGRAGPGGTYTLTITIALSIAPASAYEPNDTTGTASWMGYASINVAGEFIGDGSNGRRDVDIYRLTLLAPARLDAKASSADELFDPVVRLRSCDTALPTPTQDDDCLLGSADDGPDGSRDASVSVAVFEPGDVYIMVSGAGNRAYDPTVAGSGEFGSVAYYDLSVTVSGLSPVASGEPNDSIPTATQLPLLVEGRPDSIAIDAFIGDGPYATLRGDRDFYAVRLLYESRVLNIDVQAASIGSAFRPIVIAYDLQGRIRGFADGSLTGDANLMLPAGCILAYPEGEGRSLILAVMGTMQRRPNDPFDPFNVASPPETVQDHHVADGAGSTGAYRLRVSPLPSSQACGGEPNDTFSNAIPTGLVDEGLFFCADAYLGDSLCWQRYFDTDVWSLNVTRGPATLRADIFGCNLEELGAYLDLRVFDAHGRELGLARYPGTLVDELTLSLSVDLNYGGRFYVAVSPYCTIPFDLHEECSMYCGGLDGYYDLAVSLTPYRGAAVATAGANGPSPPPDASRLFSQRLDDAADTIDVLDAESGNLLSSLDAPEPRFGGSGGLATNGADLFFLGTGRFPTLYRMDPTTGDVLEKYFTWFGSGYFSNATMLGGEMYLLDYRQRRVHVVDPFEPRYSRSLALGTMHGITIGGGLASLSGPNRLYVADAYNTRSIYEVYPATGALTATLPPTDNRPTALAGVGSSRLFVGDFRTKAIDVIDRIGGAVERFAVGAPAGALAGVAGIGLFADFDADGDVDLKDLAVFQTCFLREGVAATECARGDQDGNEDIDLLDMIAIPGASTGP
ncbi:MAG: hypothetical protein Q7R41_19480, partial [Phycisphaerales bacterium]|nr:hypothetical protein [Phycisphaerales bacterium]